MARAIEAGCPDVPTQRHTVHTSPCWQIGRFLAYMLFGDQPAVVYKAAERALGGATRERRVVAREVGGREWDPFLDDEEEAGDEAVDAHLERVVDGGGEQPLRDAHIARRRGLRGVRLDRCGGSGEGCCGHGIAPISRWQRATQTQPT